MEKRKNNTVESRKKIHVQYIAEATSLLRSRFLGCHAMLPPKKRLLTSEQHSFPLFGQSQLSFHFREPCRAKFALWDLSNQRSFFIFPSHGGKVINQQCRQWSWRSFPSHVFQGSILRAWMLTGSLQCEKLSTRRKISSLMCHSLICRKFVWSEL